MQELSDLILYKASAGSGKTYTLAKEYLKIIVLNPYDYNKILAVTFTKKATAEMKTRIIDYLTLLEKKDTSVDALRATIIREIQDSKAVDVSEYFDKNVSTALQLILHDYSNFNISTIDSFFQGIIRSFAKELDLPIGMEVELDTDSVLQHSVQAMLKEYKTDKDAFSKWLEEYVIDQIEEDKSWKIEKNIQKLATQLLKEEYQLLAAAATQRFDIETYKQALKELKQIVFEYRKKIDALTNSVLQKVENDRLDLSLYFQGNKSVRSFINTTRKYEPEANSYVQKMLQGGSLFSKDTAKDATLAVPLEAAWNNYLQPYIVEVLEFRDKYQKRYFSAEIVLKNIYSLALLEYINTQLKTYKADKNLILISDTNQIVSLIAQHEEVPFIFEKSASFLKYILVDEFQDTSTLQWKGMLPLLLEILQQVNGLVLIVGDPKQSIYRWRGGRMELIIDGIAADMSYHWENRKDVSLTENYRSAKEIVAFNNAFFSTIKNKIPLQHKLFKDVLADVEQKIVKADKKGFVQCQWLEKSKEEDVHLIEILNIIQAQAKHKRYSDIAILTRNNKHGAAVANYLQQQHIPVVSAESLLLQNQPAIRLLIAAIEYLVHPNEPFYQVKLNYQYAAYLQQPHAEQFLTKQANGSYFFEEKIPALRQDKVLSLSTVAVNELVFLLLQFLSLDQQADNYLLRFQDVVFNYAQQYSTSPSEFLTYLEEQKESLSIIPPEGMDAVKIYTIHKSKGLQFPVVIVPYAAWKMTPKPDTMVWVKSEEPPFQNLNVFPVEMAKKLEQSLFEEAYRQEVELNYIDNVNLLYVAFTRAEEQLYILSEADKNAKNEAIPQSVSKLLYVVLPELDLNGVTTENNRFEYGEIVQVQGKEQEAIPLLPLQPVLLHDFRKEIVLAKPKTYNEAQVKGNILHEILSKIKQPEQLLKAVATTTTEEVQLYTQAAKEVTDLFQQHGWFDLKWQHLNERNIMYKGELLRADRILLSEDACVIIDYKTGAREPAHQQQLKKYKEAYTALLQRPVTACLLYTDTLEIQQVN